MIRDDCSSQSVTEVQVHGREVGPVGLVASRVVTTETIIELVERLHRRVGQPDRALLLGADHRARNDVWLEFSVLDPEAAEQLVIRGEGAGKLALDTLVQGLYQGKVGSAAPGEHSKDV